MKDADAFMRLLSKASPEIAMRVMEESAYAEATSSGRTAGAWRWRT